jgi:hypothetical protein
LQCGMLHCNMGIQRRSGKVGRRHPVMDRIGGDPSGVAVAARLKKIDCHR